jgi:hypothetical protein
MLTKFEELEKKRVQQKPIYIGDIVTNMHTNLHAKTTLHQLFLSCLYLFSGDMFFFHFSKTKSEFGLDGFYAYLLTIPL